MSLNDVLKAGDEERQRGANTHAARSSDAVERCRALWQKAHDSICEAFENTEGLGTITVQAGRTHREQEQVHIPIVGQTATEGQQLAVLVQGEIGWRLGQTLGQVGSGYATPLKISVRRLDRSFLTEVHFSYDVGTSLPFQGNYSIQRKSMQAKLLDAVKHLSTK